MGIQTGVWTHSDREGIRDPIEHVADVTPSDTEDLPVVTRRIYIGAPGSLKVTCAGSGTVTYEDMDVGMYWMRVQRVHATGTTADNIIAEW